MFVKLLGPLCVAVLLSGCFGGSSSSSTSDEGAGTTPAATATDASVSDTAVTQAGDGELVFPVSFADADHPGGQLHYELHGLSAESGRDFVDDVEPISVAPGVMSTEIRVPLANEAVLEEDRELRLRLQDAGGFRPAGDGGEALGVIRPNPEFETMIWSGAAKRVVTPTQEQVDGIEEERPFGQSQRQRFHLGGFGIGPLEAFPEPLNEAIANGPAGGRVHEGELGPEHTHVRVQYLRHRDEEGKEQEAVLIVLDAVGAGNIIQHGLRHALHEATGIAPDDILFGQTHTHAGADLQGLWGGVPQQWIDNDDPDNPGVYQLTADAVAEAMDDSQPVRLRVADTDFPEGNSYRRARILGDEEADSTLTVMNARSELHNDVVATLVQYVAHPTNVGAGEDPRVPHPDYIIGVTEFFERHMGGVTLYYNGPIAEASSSGPGGDDDYQRSRARGLEIAQQAFAALIANGQELSPSLRLQHQDALLVNTNPLFAAAAAVNGFDRYYQFNLLPVNDLPLIGSILEPLPVIGDLTSELPLVGSGSLLGGLPDLASDVPLLGGLLTDLDQQLPQVAMTTSTRVSRLTLGDGGGVGLELVTVPGETTNTFGSRIRDLTESSHTMLLGLTNDSFGYIVPEEEYGVGELLAGEDPYEELVSLGPLTAPLLLKQAYYPLFDADIPTYAPDYLAGCGDPDQIGTADCLLGRVRTYLENSVPAEMLLEGADRLEEVFPDGF